MDRVRELTPQFLRTSKIDVMILKKINPVNFIIKEMPTLDMSEEMKAFQELEKDVQSSYPDDEQRFSSIPKEKKLVIVHRVDDDKFYRAFIREVQRGRPKTLFKVYLVDYGKEFTVTKDRLFMCKKDFENFPFQAVEFVLMGLQPFSLQITLDGETLSFSKAATWDCSAEEYVDSLLECMVSAQVETKGHYDEDGRIYGSMYIATEDESGTLTSPFCLDTYLIDKKYACMDVNALRNVHQLEEDYDPSLTSGLPTSGVHSILKTYTFCLHSSDSEDAKSESRRKCQDTANILAANSSHQPSMSPDRHSSVSLSVSSSPSSSISGKQSVSSNPAKISVQKFGRGVNILRDLNTRSSATTLSSEKSSSASSARTVITATQRKSVGSGLPQLICFGRGVINMKNLKFIPPSVNKSSLSEKQKNPDLPPDSFSLSSPPLRRQSIVDDLVRESPENPQPSSSSTVEVSVADSDSLSPSSSSSGRKGLGGNSPKTRSPSYGRGVNAIRKLNQTYVAIKSPPSTHEQQKAMIESLSPSAAHEPKKSLCGNSLKKCSPSFGRGVNLSMNLNQTYVAIKSPPSTHEQQKAMIESLSPSAAHEPKKSLCGNSLKKCSPSFGRGVNLSMNLNRTSISANTSAAVNSKNCITTTPSLSTVESGKTILGATVANKILPGFGRGVNGITHLKKDAVKALVEDYAKNSSSLPKASVVDNIGSDSSSVRYQSLSNEHCAKSCSAAQTPFSLEGSGNVHSSEGSENPLMSSTKVLHASDVCSKTSSLMVMDSSKGILSYASSGQFSDYESDYVDSKDKLIIESASSSNSIPDKCPDIKTLTKLETSVVNCVNTSVSDCSSLQCGLNNQEISKSMHHESEEQVLIEQEAYELKSSNEKSIVEFTEPAVSMVKQPLIDQKNTLSIDEPANEQVLVGSKLSLLPVNSEIVDEQVLIESEKSSCLKHISIEPENFPAALESPKEIVCKNSLSVTSYKESLDQLELHSPIQSIVSCNRESFESATLPNSLKIEIKKLSLGRGRGSPGNNIPATVSQYKEVLAFKQRNSISPLKAGKDENESIKVKSPLPSSPVFYTEIVPQLMAKQQNSGAEITENTKSPNFSIPSGMLSSGPRDSKECSIASENSIGEEQQSCSVPNDSFVEGLIQSIPNIAESSSCEDNDLEKDEADVSGAIAEPDQKNTLSIEEPANEQVLVESKLSLLPINSEIVDEQVLIESEKSSCSKHIFIEPENFPAALESPKEIVCKNSLSVTSYKESLAELELHSPIQSIVSCNRESFESATLPNSLKNEIKRLSLGRGRGSPGNNVPATVNQYKELLASKQRKSISPLKASKDENESIKVRSPLPSSPVSYTEIVPQLMAKQQNSGAEITENTKSPNFSIPSGMDSSDPRDSKECSIASENSIGEDQQSCSTPNDSFVEGLIQSIPNIAESSSCEDNDLEKDEADVSGAIAEPNRLLQHLNNTAKNSPCWLTTENYQDTSQTDLDFTDQSLYNTRGSSVIKIGSENDRQWFHVRDASFDPYIQQRLKDINFCGPSCIQTVFWPMVTTAQTQAIIAIGPQHSGKTVGYLVPILSNLIRGYEYKHLPKSNGPNMIILCSSWRKVVDVSRQAELFLGQCNKVNVLTLCTDGVDEQTKIIRLMNGCEILVATPLCLMQYSEKKAVNFNRCCHLIFDDGNDIVKYYPNILPTIMKTCLKCIESRKKAESFIQLILCAEQWTRRLAAFVRKFMFHELSLLFISYLEAAVYCQVPMQVHMCQESTKATRLLSILESMTGKKIVICSTNSENADIVYNTLRNASCCFLYAREDTVSYNLKSLKIKWESPRSEDENVIMVLTDSNLLQLDLDDADCLIHFDLPEVSRLQFSNRFSCIKKNMHPEKKEEAVCHVLFTEKCQTQASSLITILCRIGSNIPAELKHQSIIQRKAIKNMDMPLCHYMKSLGSCSVRNCEFRHIIDKTLDCPVVVPSEGDIHASVSHIFSPVHFYMKISRYTDPKTKTVVSVTGEYAATVIRLQDFYRANESKLKSSSEIKVGKLYAIKENMEYHRCKVLKIIEFQCQARVLYIDEGFVKTVKFEQFRSLPEELRQKRPFAVEAYLCKVKPIDPYHDWNPGATKYMFDLISGQEIDAKIVFCLGETLFLDPAVIRTGHISYVQGHVNLKHLSFALKSKGFAVANEKHLDLLYKASHGKIEPPEILKSSPVEQTSADRTGANWAFLELNSIEIVFVSHIESPDQFFVQRAKSVDSLDKLLKDISLKIENKSLSPCQTLQVGMFCLAPCPSDENYNRSEIVNLVEVSGEMVAHVRFVDYGDCGQAKKSALFALPPELLLLPFQAIECSLVGVVPCHGGWTENVNDTFYDLTRDRDDNQIELKIMASEKTKRSIGGNHYTVDLQINTETYASNYLVENGFAENNGIPWRLDYMPETNVNHSEDDDEVLSDDDDSENCVDRECAMMLAGVYAGGITTQNFDAYLYLLRERARLKSSVDAGDGKKVQDGSGAPLNNSQCTSVQSSPFPPDSNDDLTHSRIPLVTWWDTLQEVIVTIHVADVQTYDLEIHADGFKFETTVMQKRYVVEETFYDEIVQDEVKPKCLGGLIEFRFKKKTETIWLRLIKSDEKMFYIKRDLNHIIDTDDEDSEGNASHGVSETACAGPSGISAEANVESRERGVIESEEDSENNDSSSDDEEDYEGFAKLCDPRSSFEFLS